MCPPHHRWGVAIIVVHGAGVRASERGGGVTRRGAGELILVATGVARGTTMTRRELILVECMACGGRSTTNIS